MAITRAAAAAVAGGTILAASWESEFNNIINNALALVSPWTGNMAAGGFRLTGLGLGVVADPALQFTGDTNTGIYSSAADTVNVSTAGVLAAEFGASAIIAAAPEDARTATVDVAAIIRSTTSGVPAAGIGTGLQFDAESADENPSVFGRLDFLATDITAASEDTDAVFMLRTAGAAVAEAGRVTSDGGYRPGAVAPATPVANVLYRDSVVKGWVRFDVAGTIDDDLNVSSVTDNATGDWTVNWARAFANANYTVVPGLSNTGTNPSHIACQDGANAPTTTATRIITGAATGGISDPTGTGVKIHVIVIGDQ